MIRSNLILTFLCVVVGCNKESTEETWIKSDYTGTYKNIVFTEQLLHTYTSGIYYENDIPADVQHLTYGRIEVDFNYNSRALTYFSPLFYYGSINKNNNDDGTEKPKFHMAIELGHYNVIPTPVENLFYTISTYRQPQYCRDTDCPVIPGIDYTLVIDKRPEGIILQLKQGDDIVNIFPHAYFPDSSQLFFNDVTSYTDKNKGDSLQKVLMVGKGFAGFEDGIHDMVGTVGAVRIYKYTLAPEIPVYNLQFVRNQQAEGQEVTYSLTNKQQGEDKFLVVKDEFMPYKFESSKLHTEGVAQTKESTAIPNNGMLQTYRISDEEIGLHKLYVRTTDNEGNTITSTLRPFEIWVYPKAWNFEFYKL